MASNQYYNLIVLILHCYFIGLFVVCIKKQLKLIGNEQDFSENKEDIVHEKLIKLDCGFE